MSKRDLSCIFLEYFVKGVLFTEILFKRLNKYSLVVKGDRHIRYQTKRCFIFLERANPAKEFEALGNVRVWIDHMQR